MGEMDPSAPVYAGGMVGLAGDDRPFESVPAEVEAIRRRLLRLAFDVHDGPMQDLIAIAYRMQSMRNEVCAAARPEQAVELSKTFEEFGAQLGQVEQGLRSLMFSLEHDAAAQSSLLTSVDAHVAAFELHAAASVDVVVEGDVEPRTDSQRIAIERVVRESLSNIAKHADAEQVAILLRGTSDSIFVQVCDDGRGFWPEDTSGTSTRVGLHAMRERLRLIGGELTIDSRPGGPTVVTALIEKWQPQTDAALQGALAPPRDAHHSTHGGRSSSRMLARGESGSLRARAYAGFRLELARGRMRRVRPTTAR